jgi:hypothetical protein
MSSRAISFRIDASHGRIHKRRVSTPCSGRWPRHVPAHKTNETEADKIETNEFGEDEFGEDEFGDDEVRAGKIEAGKLEADIGLPLVRKDARHPQCTDTPSLSSPT